MDPQKIYDRNATNEKVVEFNDLLVDDSDLIKRNNKVYVIACIEPNPSRDITYVSYCYHRFISDTQKKYTDEHETILGCHYKNNKYGIPFIIKYFSQYCERNHKKLTRDFERKFPKFSGCRMLKILGSFPNFAKAEERTREIGERDSDDIKYKIVEQEAGFWQPFNPSIQELKKSNVKYADEKMQQLMAGQIEHNKEVSNIFKKRRQILLANQKERRSGVISKILPCRAPTILIFLIRMEIIFDQTRK